MFLILSFLNFLSFNQYAINLHTHLLLCYLFLFLYDTLITLKRRIKHCTSFCLILISLYLSICYSYSNCVCRCIFIMVSTNLIRCYLSWLLIILISLVISFKRIRNRAKWYMLWKGCYLYFTIFIIRINNTKYWHSIFVLLGSLHFWIVLY